MAEAQFSFANLMPWLVASQAAQSLGNVFINTDRNRRGLAPVQDQGGNPYQLMQLAQMQEQSAQRQAAQKAIGALDIDPNVRTLMSLYPEETARAYVQGQFKQEREAAPFLSTGAGVFDTREKRIVPGTEPQRAASGPDIRSIPVGDQQVTYAIDPATSEMREIARAPRWQPDTGGGGGGGGQALASQLRMLPMSYPDPTTGQMVTTTVPLAVQPQRGAPPNVQVMQIPGMTMPGSSGPTGVPGIQTKVEGLKPLPRDAQEGLTAISSGVRALNTMQSTIDETGRIKGIASKVGALTGTNEKAIAFETARNNNMIAAQQLIPGIPSDKDAARLEATQPSLTATQEENRSRLQFQKDSLRELAEIKIGSLRGLGYQIPEEVRQTAEQLGVSIDKVPAMEKSQVDDRLSRWRSNADNFVAKNRNTQLQVPRPPAPQAPQVAVPQASVPQSAPLPTTAQPTPNAGQPQRVSSKADYDKLPPGTVYIAPDGSRRVKK